MHITAVSTTAVVAPYDGRVSSIVSVNKTTEHLIPYSSEHPQCAVGQPLSQYYMHTLRTLAQPTVVQSTCPLCGAYLHRTGYGVYCYSFRCPARSRMLLDTQMSLLGLPLANPAVGDIGGLLTDDLVRDCIRHSLRWPIISTFLGIGHFMPDPGIDYAQYIGLSFSQFYHCVMRGTMFFPYAIHEFQGALESVFLVNGDTLQQIAQI